ncbi:copper response regulator transcription factor CrdR [Helicobacter ailurogastricus]|uniref:Two-component system response regulator n=1 Tax=Helicobacter ailurogastricus TaxID=1578720 RepID=A0A0K2X5E6_9HELI|nr:copper response regulator transcription factor CrdR [Helicobacter ailurogastricus]GLH59291.1 OmpR family DNA-binding response regulator [Helicobacter ailurogastricus]CRF41112.1 Two-component system response regulator [Helicobacter ailurogastricus]CRF42480.1 Two-component system response regulator [Helicobacter ailurogastricus]CRF44698.1 Two-component system response regulator [Helicobacter ailurogastricus]
MKKLFLLEDDVLLHKVLAEFLEHAGFALVGAYNQARALEILSQQSFDLLLLDIQLPESDGFGVLQTLRDLDISTPAIFISARNDIHALRRAFSVGASDYLKKPFDLEELRLRMERLLAPPKLQIGPECFYENGVLHTDKPHFLSPKEKRLLEFFIRHKNQVLGSEQIIANVWDYEGIDSSTLRSHIKNLRKLLGKEQLQNIKGLGYCLKIP